VFVYLLTEEQLGQPYEGLTQQDAIAAAVAAQGITAGTVYVIPQARVRKVGLTSEPKPPTVTIVSDDPVT
jgi:hypothetical protein